MKSFTLFFIVIKISSVCSNYYELLGITKDADNREIRKAFKALALKFHPDKNMEKTNAHEEFLRINEAYEVLKDPDLRKKYDLYGKEGLKDDFGKTWKGQYQSWNFYHENFGIYDDDKEVITLNRYDFEQSVLESSELWFVNFYSPHCSHCHTLAPSWRRLASYFDGVLRIGAVNCEDDFMLCRQQQIHSYPSLIMYPNNKKYHGSYEFENLKEFVFDFLPSNIVEFNSYNLDEVLSSQHIPVPWLIFTCKDSNGCIDSDDMKKLAVILRNLVNVAKIESASDEKICEIMLCNEPVTLYLELTTALSKQKSFPVKNMEISQLVKEIMQYLPKIKELDKNSYQDMRENMKKAMALPTLIIFFKSEAELQHYDIDLKRVKASFPDISFAYFNCMKEDSVCSSLFIQKFPSIILFKHAEAYEVHYGAMTSFDISKFLRETSSSQVKTLTPHNFPHVVESSETWIIDFFAPWCAPCMQFMPHWRKVSQSSYPIKFGSIDCTIHTSLCRSHNIHSYPTVILYNQTVPHKYQGHHSSSGIEEFIEDILSPMVISLTPHTYQKLVELKKSDIIWVIDFFAPWCSPCQQLAVQWRKTAKSFKNKEIVHIGQVDCEKYSHFCQSLDIQSYPTIRLYPISSISNEKYINYQGRKRDFSSLRIWIYQYLPSKVTSLSGRTFQDVLSDSQPWLIDFFAPWCGHCHSFAPEFEKLAEVINGKVKLGKINCEDYSSICQMAHVNAYPTVLFYKGKHGVTAQNAKGLEVYQLTYNGIINFLKKNVIFDIKESTNHDEL